VIKILYIAGPITGIRDYRQRFAEAREDLLDAGYEVLDPTTIAGPSDASWEWWMRRTITMLCRADGVALLDGWSNSRGARIELDLARNLEMTASSLELWIDLAEQETTE
jgi:hypothetical protein